MQTNCKIIIKTKQLSMLFWYIIIKTNKIAWSSKREMCTDNTGKLHSGVRGS